MSEELLKYLQDVLDAVNAIETFTVDTESFHHYQHNLMLKAAVERKLGVVGEAMNKACKLSPDLPIASKRKIIGLRNRIIHSYDAVDDILMWEVVKKHLPTLKADVLQILNP